MAGEHTTVAIAEGLTMPLLGLGVWQIPEGPETSRAVGGRSRLGYRHIDTAQAYGNEASVGRALRDSGMPREDVFLTTKFCPGRRDPERRPREPAAARRRPGSTSTSSTGRRAARRGHGRGWSAPQRTATHARSASRISRGASWTSAGGRRHAPGRRPGAVQPAEVPSRAARGMPGARHRLEAYSPLGTAAHLDDIASRSIAGRRPHARPGPLRWCAGARPRRDPQVRPPRADQENGEVFGFTLPTTTWPRSTRSTDGRHGPRPRTPVVVAGWPRPCVRARCIPTATGGTRRGVGVPVAADGIGVPAAAPVD